MMLIIYRSSKTLLLFVIRDHIREMTPLEALRDQMIKDVEKLWGNIMKPTQFEDSKVTDFFDFEFTSLPHKLLQEDLFNKEIELMRDRFVNPNAKGYVFNPKYKKSVPIDDFEMYAKDIWEVIYANKDLDIPTQKEMLAMYRCDEISSALYRPFEEQIIEWSEILKKKQLVSKFGSKSHDIIEKTLAHFMDQTKLYVPDVVHKKCEEFKERMVSEVAILFTSQIALIKQQSLDAFKKFMFSNVQKKIDDNEIVDDFTNTTKQTHDYITNFFTGLAEESIYPGLNSDEQFNFNPSLESLEEEIKNIIEEYRHKQVEVIVKIQIDEMKKHIREDINQWVTKPTEKLWVTLSNYLTKVVTEEKEHLAKSLKDLDIADCSKFVPRIRVAARNEIVTKVREMSNVISLTLTSRFEDLFKRDENNILRAWKNMEQIKEDYTKARQEAIKILDIFFLCRLDHREFDDIHLRLPKLDESGGIGDFAFPASDDIRKVLKHVKVEESSTNADEGNEVEKKDVMSLFEENLIMSENICIRAYENYIMRTDNIYGDVQRAQLIAQQNKANIPYWVYILLVVLGWDEIYSIIRNPIYLILILVVVVFLFQTWLKSKVQELIEDPETNPTIAFALQMAQVHIFPYLAMANVERMIPPPATLTSTNTTSSRNSSSNVRFEESSSESTVRQRSQVKKAKMENQISLHQHDE